MAGRVATVNVGLVATTNQFKSELKSATTPLKALKAEARATDTAVGKLGSTSARASTPIGNLGRSLSNFGTGLLRGGWAKAIGLITGGLALLTGGGMAAMAKQSLDLADSLVKTADAIGIGADELSALRYASNRAGLANEDLDKNLLRLNRTIGQAAHGSKAGREAFRLLGLEVDTLANATPDEQFRALADAFANVRSQVEKTRLATALFGKTGQGVLAVLAMGRSELDRIESEARQFGIALDDIDYRRTDDLGDSLANLKARIQAVSDTAVSFLAPALTDVADKMFKISSGADDMKTKVSSALEEISVNGFKASRVIQELVSSAGLLDMIPGALQYYGIRLGDIAKAGKAVTSIAVGPLRADFWADMAEGENAIREWFYQQKRRQKEVGEESKVNNPLVESLKDIEDQAKETKKALDFKQEFSQFSILRDGLRGPNIGLVAQALQSRIGGKKSAIGAAGKQEVKDEDGNKILNQAVKLLQKIKENTEDAGELVLG